MTNRRSIIGLVALLLMPLAVRAADITGSWSASFDTAIGHMDYVYNFTVKGGVLTGTVKVGSSESQILEGKVDADRVSFVEVFKYEGNEVRIAYTGKVSSADEIQFSRDVMGMAQEQVVAKRTK